VVLVLLWLRADLLADREAQMQARLRLHASLLGGEISDLLQSGEQLGRAERAESPTPPRREAPS
jgi:hypothetical protein